MICVFSYISSVLTTERKRAVACWHGQLEELFEREMREVYPANDVRTGFLRWGDQLIPRLTLQLKHCWGVALHCDEVSVVIFSNLVERLVKCCAGSGGVQCAGVPSPVCVHMQLLECRFLARF